VAYLTIVGESAGLAALAAAMTADEHRIVITRRPPGAGAAKAVAATLAATVLVGATAAGDARTSGGRVQSADERRIACATENVIVDITTHLGYPPWGQVLGTGVIIAARGDVLTNNHVVAGAASLELRTSAGRTYPGRVVATDIVDDLALVRIAGGHRFPAARLGDSSTLTVGQTAYAIGDGHGDCGTPQVTQGRITGLGRSTYVSDAVYRDRRALRGLIAADVEVEPGYSGGALLGDDAEVIGILTVGQLAQSCACYRGVLAIPSNRARRLAAQMAAGVASAAVHIGPTATLGVAAAGTADVMPAFVRGALITYIRPGSPADRLGMELGDQIVALDGRQVRGALDLATVLQTRLPGEVVQVSWTDASWHPHTATTALVAGPPQ
jgi:S1-C subfamily serine protease